LTELLEKIKGGRFLGHSVHVQYVVLQAFVGEWRVDAGATLQLQMVRFVNPGGKDYGGDCCDRFIWCTGSCDHIFRFALDRGNRYTFYMYTVKTATLYVRTN